LGIALAWTAYFALPTSAQVDRISGTVQSFDGTTVVLTDGRSFAVPEGTSVRVARRVGPAELSPNLLVAVTVQRGVDGTLFASRINAFPPELGDLTLGQRPLDGDNLMTNASIDEATIDMVEGGELTVSFLGQTERVHITETTFIQLNSAGTASDIVPGVAITGVVRDGVTQRVDIERDR
jgi:hypothetical protein